MSAAKLMSREPAARCSAAFNELRVDARRWLISLTKDALGYEDDPPPNDEDFQVGMVMLCALLQTGPHAVRISRITGIPQQRCCWWGIRLRTMGVFGHGGVAADPWMREEDGRLHFAFDVLEARRHIRRKGPRGGAETLYWGR